LHGNNFKEYGNKIQIKFKIKAARYQYRSAKSCKCSDDLSNVTKIGMICKNNENIIIKRLES